jgi:hypothetical protein
VYSFKCVGVAALSSMAESKGEEQEQQPDANGAETSAEQHHKPAAEKKAKRKKMPRLSSNVLNIEELFVSVSKVVASGINPPPAGVILTPRSAESCLMHGINPEILRIRDLDSFWEPEIEQEVQQLRHDVYSQRRHEMMRLCRQERRRLQSAEQTALAAAASGSNVGSNGATLTPQQLLEAAAAHGQTMIEVEERRIEKMRRRQEKEVYTHYISAQIACIIVGGVRSTLNFIGSICICCCLTDDDDVQTATCFKQCRLSSCWPGSCR